MFEVNEWNYNLDVWQTRAVFYTQIDAEIYVSCLVRKHSAKSHDFRIEEVRAA